MKWASEKDVYKRQVLDGTAYCQAVYRQGEESTLRALTAQATLNQVIDVPGASTGMISRALAQVEQDVYKRQVLLCSVDGGGLRNAIPREAEAVVMVKTKEYEAFATTCGT